MITDDTSLTLAIGMDFLAGRYISCMQPSGTGVADVLVLGTARFGPSGSAAGEDLPALSLAEDRGSDDVDRGRRARPGERNR
jgi:hypothetical protein